MITKLNLATHPFRNRTLPYVTAALMLVIGAVIGVYCLATLNQNRRQNELLATAVKDRGDEIARLRGEGEKVQQLLTPDQKVLLTAAHKLIANKQFAWSRLFADLETVLPGSVSASKIRVENVYQDGDRVRADLELGVIAHDYASIMSMLENMQNSGLFRAELRGQDLEKNERGTYTEYTFRVIYTPGYSAPAGPDVARSGGDQ